MQKQCITSNSESILQAKMRLDKLQHLAVFIPSWGYFLQGGANRRLMDQTYRPTSWGTDLFWEQGRGFG
jgi:hypothetical protein